MEWTYQGKFFDRSPNIRAAGAPLKKCDKLSECLKGYPIDDAIETVLAEAGLHKVPLQIPAQRMVNCRHTGIYTGCRKVLSPPVETRYQTLLRDLQETSWESYWTKQLGRTADPIGSLPLKVTEEDFIFGAPSCVHHPSGEELLNPKNITPYEMAFNDAEHHEMYKKTHRDYFPAEQINRQYGPPYDRTQRYGSIPVRRPTAICSMKMFTDKPLEMTNDILADHIERTQCRLGKALTPHNNIKCVEPNHRFGKKSTRNYHALADLLQPHRTTSLFRKDFYTWLSTLLEVRRTWLKRKANFKELQGYCIYADINDTKWLHINVFQRILLDNYLSFPHADVLPLATCFGIYKDEQVHYDSMLDLLNEKIELPDLRQFKDDNPSDEFITTAQFERCMAKYKDNSNDRPAGLELGSMSGQSERENLGKETRLAALVNPSILTNYGLSHVDLLQPRKPEYLRKLFERLGYQFPGDTFDVLWNIGKEWDKNDNVSADTFRKIMEQAAPIEIKEEPEDECFRDVNATVKQCA